MWKKLKLESCNRSKHLLIQKHSCHFFCFLQVSLVIEVQHRFQNQYVVKIVIFVRSLLNQ
jgi:hypothetical protein